MDTQLKSGPAWPKTPERAWLNNEDRRGDCPPDPAVAGVEVFTLGDKRPQAILRTASVNTKAKHRSPCSTPG